MPRNATHWAVLLAALAATGCAQRGVVGADGVAAQMASEISGLSGASEITVVEIDISRGLMQALPGAVGASSRYRAALAATSAAEAQSAAAAGGLRPQVTLGATVGGIREGSTPTTRSGTTTGAAGNLNLSQLIYDGGAAAERVNEATARAAGASWSQAATAGEVALSASRAWVDLWLATERLALFEDQSGQLSDIMGQLDRMAGSGIIDRTALDAAQSSLLELDLQRADLERAREAARTAFRRHFKGLPSGAISLPQELSARGALAMCEQWASAPELQVAAAELIAARAAHRAAEAAFQPAASLRAGVTSPMDRDDSTDVNLGVGVTYDISRGGSRQAQLEAARAREAAADAGLDDTEEALRNDLSDLRHQLLALEARSEVIGEQVALSATQSQNAITQITTGQSSLSGVLSARVGEYRSRDSLLQIQAEATLLKLTIAARVGHLAQLVAPR